MKTPSTGFVVSVLSIGALYGGLMFLGRGSSSDNFFHTKRGRVHMELTAIASAVTSYQKEFQREPPIPTEEFFASLCGDNPRKIRFLSSLRTTNTESWIRYDVWSSPYQVFHGASGWLIRSAGPNRVFDELPDQNTDDITIIVPKADNNKQNKSEQATPRNPSD